jgi:hypothetical protein
MLLSNERTNTTSCIQKTEYLTRIFRHLDVVMKEISSECEGHTPVFKTDDSVVVYVNNGRHIMTHKLMLVVHVAFSIIVEVLGVAKKDFYFSG